MNVVIKAIRKTTTGVTYLFNVTHKQAKTNSCHKYSSKECFPMDFNMFFPIHNLLIRFDSNETRAGIPNANMGNIQRLFPKWNKPFVVIMVETIARSNKTILIKNVVLFILNLLTAKIIPRINTGKRLILTATLFVTSGINKVVKRHIIYIMIHNGSGCFFTML